MDRSRTSIAALALLPLLAAACHGGRHPATAVAKERNDDAGRARSMNPFVLTNLVSNRLAVEIDRVEGWAPSSLALTALEETLRRHCEEGKLIRIAIDDEIPLTVWNELDGRSGIERLVERYLDTDPGGWRDEELLYVLYLPRSKPLYGTDVSGMADSITIQRNGVHRTVPTISLFETRIRRDAMLWITPAKVERAILIHEVGHVLGLVSNSRHADPDHPAHCTQSGCVMNQPGARSTLSNALAAFFAGKVPHRYGKLCRADIDAAKRAWAAQATADPAFVDRLREKRMRSEAQGSATLQAR